MELATTRGKVGLGLGVGRFLGQGRFSLLLYYQQYSRILENYDPPKQVTLSSFIKLSPVLMLSTGIQVGFSESSPDYGLLTALELTL